MKNKINLIKCRCFCIKNVFQAGQAILILQNLKDYSNLNFRFCLLIILSERPSVNFTNVLHTAFAHVDPKCIKIYWGFDWIIKLSGSTRVKAVCRTLMKLSPSSSFMRSRSIHTVFSMFVRPQWKQKNIARSNSKITWTTTSIGHSNQESL